MLTRVIHRGRGPTADLIDWEVEHADPGGRVWLAAVVGRDWALYPPGFTNCAHNDPLHRVQPLWVKYNEVGRRRPRLRRVRHWLKPWVESFAYAPVVDMVEGWGWYGPEFDRARYVIYLRIGPAVEP